MMNIPDIQIYNTLSRTKTTLNTLEPRRIGLYVCGMTVYDLCHLGHARVMIFFDTMVRYMRNQGYQVRYVRNITDIDDKIFARANQLGIHYSELTSQCITKMHQDFAALDCLPPDEEPRVTQYITQIIEMISKLIERGYAYTTDYGDVYYRVNRFTNYGQLSGKKLDQLLTGVRIEPNSNKENPLDFALWKVAKADEAHWQSPWSKGRPGWHIECSAMSTSLLGRDFDIHGGGPDLVFPHHENEIAQSCGAYDCRYASYWMHVAPLRAASGEKMSKSLGNFFTIRDLLAQYRGEHLRFFLSRSHYRTPIEFDVKLIDESAKALDRLYQSISGLTINTRVIIDNEYSMEFHRSMRDDYNTPQALAALFSLARRINTIKASDQQQASILASQLVRLARSIGLMLQTAQNYFKTGSDSKNTGQDPNQNRADNTVIEELIAERNQAKHDKDYARADAIRQQLAQKKIILEDTPQGTKWRKR